MIFIFGAIRRLLRKKAYGKDNGEMEDL